MIEWSEVERECSEEIGHYESSTVIDGFNRCVNSEQMLRYLIEFPEKWACARWECLPVMKYGQALQTILDALKREASEGGNADRTAARPGLKGEACDMDSEIAGPKVEADGVKACESTAESKEEIEALRAEVANLRIVITELADVLSWTVKQASDIGAASVTGSLDASAVGMSMAGLTRRCHEVLNDAYDVVKGKESTDEKAV